MAFVYYKLIKVGRKMIEEVPETIKSEVQSLLDAEQQ